MSNVLELAARLSLDGQKWTQGLGRARQGMRGFTNQVRGELRGLGESFRSIEGRLGSIGLGFTVAGKLVKSAQMDQSLTRIKQTASLTADQTKRLRTELYSMAIEAGTSVDELQAGFGGLAAGGLSFEKALPTINAINHSMRVTGSSAETLSGALLSAQEHFGFDLAKAGQAEALLDKMTVAGRSGVIELEDLSGAFASAAVNAKSAGLNFDQTLALFEGLGTTTTKDRLGTLVDSTLRVFTNDNYMKAAQKATGVQFFKGKDRRNPLDILGDIAKKYQTLQGDKAQFAFISAAFGKADIDTQKGIQAALRDGKLEQILKIVKDVEQSSGATARDFPEAIANAAAQSERLKTSLAAAGDRLAQPINAAFANAAAFAINDTSKGGLQLGGDDMLKIGGGGLLAAYAARRFGGRLLGAIGGKVLGTASGVAEGKALEAAAGVTPVFVTNYAQIGGGLGLPGALGSSAAGAGASRVATGLLPKLALAGGSSVGSLLGAGAAGIGTATAGVAAAGVGGYYAGGAISDNLLQRNGPLGSKYGGAYGEAIGLQVAKLVALFGNQFAIDAVERAKKNGDEQRLKGELTFNLISGDGTKATLVSQKTNQKGVALKTNTGRTMSVPRAGHE